MDGLTYFDFDRRDERGDMQFKTRRLHRYRPTPEPGRQPNPVRSQRTRRRMVRQLVWSILLVLLGALIAAAFCVVLLERCGG